MDYNNIVALINKGGVLIWPILICSLLGMSVFFERLTLYRKVNKYNTDNTHVLLMVHDGNMSNALETLQQRHSKYSVIDRILIDALMIEEPDREILEMVIIHSVKQEMARLSRYLDTLAVLGSIAPLLGLLGTVIGMIKAFSVVENMGGSVNAAVLAGGIWEAMLTTAFGLIVAIPLIFFHNHLTGKLQLLQESFEDTAIRFFKAWTYGHLKGR